MNLNPDYVRKLVSDGATLGPLPQMPQQSPRIDGDEPGAKKARRLVEPSFEAPGTWTIPLYVKNSSNGKRFDRSAIGRGGHERWAVANELAKELYCFGAFVNVIRAGHRIRVVMTRLGPHRLDESCGLNTSLKYVRDTVALFCGVDDGSPLWRWEYSQEKSSAYGVRIALSVE